MSFSSHQTCGICNYTIRDIFVEVTACKSRIKKETTNLCRELRSVGVQDFLFWLLSSIEMINILIKKYTVQ